MGWHTYQVTLIRELYLSQKKLLSCVQPMKFLGIQHTQLIMHGIPRHTALDHAHKIPGHTASNHATITCQRCTLYSKLPGYGVTFVHMLTYLSNLCALSNINMAEQDIVVKTLEYSSVIKIPESKALLV